MIKRAETRKVNKVEKTEIKDGILTATYADGTVTTKPVGRVVQPERVTGAVDVAMARLRLERAAYAAAKIKPDAPAVVRVAALDALAEQSGKTSVAKALAAAAVAALAGMAAGRKSRGTTR